MKKLFFLTLLLWLGCSSTYSWSKIIPPDNTGNLTMPVVSNDSSVCLQINKMFLCVDFINPDVFRIRMNTQNNFPEGGMVRYGIVNTKCSGHRVKRITKGNVIELFTDRAKLSIDKRDGRIKLSDKNGNILIQNDLPPKSDSESGFELSFKLAEGERLYGFGDESRDQIQKRGHKNQMLVTNRTSYIPIPFVMSDHSWGVFLNTTFYHFFDAGATVKDRLSFTAPKGTLDYYLIAGESMPDILDKYTDITGKPHLLPKWGYGLTWVCDERGVRARDVLYEAYEFRRQEIPCDVIGLEPDWMEKHYDTSTKKEWSKERFHIPFWLRNAGWGTFADALKNMDFKLSLWLCTNYDFSEYEEIQLQRGNVSKKEISGTKISKSGIIKDTHLEDIKPEEIAKQEEDAEPWFEHLKKFVDDGASMFKLDGAGQVTLKFQPDRKWKNGMGDNEMINLYPLLYSKQMSLGFREHTGRRAMIFTVGGYAGIQRYSATWAGDTGGGTGPMVSLLNHGLSGHSNVCTDMQTNTEAGIHFGFLQTLTQVLGWHMYVEPWFLGEKKASMFKDYANLRYKIIPYIYSMAHIASETAMPVMRAMPLIYPDDPECDKFMYQYMFGDAFLVSAFAKTVYLPEGEWIDYWTGKRWEGNQEINSEFPENRGGPLFVKAGSIIPTQAVRSHIGTATPEQIVWEIYPKGTSEFTLYEDDGESYNYLDGKIARTVLECSVDNDEISITIHPRTGKYENMPEKRTHGFKILYNREMALGDENITWNFDSRSNILTIENIPESKNELTLKVKLK